MANLIITIISIALVAVAALMGAYYGGTAFLKGQAKAHANALIGDLQQIGAAAQLYFSTERAGNNVFPAGNYNTVVDSYLIPNYLQSSINKPIYGGVVYIYGISKTTGEITGAPSVSPATVAAILPTGYSGTDLIVDVCQQFLDILGPNQAGLVFRTPPSYDITIPPADITAGKRWFCVMRDNDSSGTLSSGDTGAYFYYMFI